VLTVIKEYVASRFVYAGREEVLTLYLIMMTPNMRTGCADAGRVRVVLNPAA
jgi:ABC-type maltose transport system permease subunit